MPTKVECPICGYLRVYEEHAEAKEDQIAHSSDAAFRKDISKERAEELEEVIDVECEG